MGRRLSRLRPFLLQPNPHRLIPNPVDDLDHLVRRVDEDRWLASRFAPAPVRERLTAIYAVNYEVARTAEIVSEGALGDIRLEWWREALAEIRDGKPPRSHPALVTLHRTLKRREAAAIFEEIIAARSKDLEPAPFMTWDALESYIDATAGGVMRLAIEASGAPGGEAGAFVLPAARAWGYAGLLRAAPYWRAKSRSAVPRYGGSAEAMLERARGYYEQARPLARGLSSNVFPAIGYIALMPGYLGALDRGRYETPAFMRQAALVAASATGRV